LIKKNRRQINKARNSQGEGQEIAFWGAIWYMFGSGPYDEIVNF
jgi:hypothetical protein